MFLVIQFSCSVVANSFWLMDCSTPGFRVYHQLPEFAQTHVHQVSDTIQPSHPLSSPSPPALNLPFTYFEMTLVWEVFFSPFWTFLSFLPFDALFQGFLFKFFFKFIYLLWAVICLCCCTGFCLVAASRGHSLASVHGLLLLWSTDSRVHGLQ